MFSRILYNVFIQTMFQSFSQIASSAENDKQKIRGGGLGENGPQIPLYFFHSPSMLIIALLND